MGGVPGGAAWGRGWNAGAAERDLAVRDLHAVDDGLNDPALLFAAELGPAVCQGLTGLTFFGLARSTSILGAFSCQGSARHTQASVGASRSYSVQDLLEARAGSVPRRARYYSFLGAGGRAFETVDNSEVRGLLLQAIFARLELGGGKVRRGELHSFYKYSEIPTRNVQIPLAFPVEALLCGAPPGNFVEAGTSCRGWQLPPHIPAVIEKCHAELTKRALLYE